MANTNKKGLVYYLRRISEALTSFGQSRDDDEKVVAYALNDLNARMEAVEARPITQSHVLEILDTTGGEEVAIATMLSNLKLDGNEPTKQSLLNLQLGSFVVLFNNDTYLAPSYLRTDVDDEQFNMFAGYNAGESEAMLVVQIAFNEDVGKIVVYEV